MNVIRSGILFIIILILISCSDGSLNDKKNTYPEIPEFSFYNQDSILVTKSTFENSVFVVDFFFTRCKSICPIMKSNMIKLYHKFKSEPDVKFLTHTIDPEYDDVATLHKYSNHFRIKSEKWHFVTGNKNEIYNIAHEVYETSVLEDSGTVEGFIHSGAFILVGKDGRIIKHYDGLKKEDIDALIEHISELISED